jgi:hypothetical protein
MHDSPDPEPWPQVPWYIPEWMLQTPTDGVTQTDGVQTAYADPDDDPDWQAAITATRAGLAGDDDGPGVSALGRRATPGADATGLVTDGPSDPQPDGGSVPQPRIGPHPADSDDGNRTVQATAGPSVSGPSVSGPSVSGPSVSGPSVSGPVRARGGSNPPSRGWFGSFPGPASAGRPRVTGSPRRRADGVPATVPGTVGRGKGNRATATHGRRVDVHPRSVGGVQRVARLVRWALPTATGAGLTLALTVQPWPAERPATAAAAGFVLGLVADRVLGRLAGPTGHRGRSRRPA